MPEFGITRTIDQVGRLTLPKEFRELLDIGENDLVEIFINNNCLILKKVQTKCTFCAQEPTMSISYKGKIVCGHCLRDICKSTIVESEE